MFIDSNHSRADIITLSATPIPSSSKCRSIQMLMKVRCHDLDTYKCIILNISFMGSLIYHIYYLTNWALLYSYFCVYMSYVEYFIPIFWYR
jgi:hypothetical protein